MVIGSPVDRLISDRVSDGVADAVNDLMTRSSRPIAEVGVFVARRDIHVSLHWTAYRNRRK